MLTKQQKEYLNILWCIAQRKGEQAPSFNLYLDPSRKQIQLKSRKSGEKTRDSKKGLGFRKEAANYFKLSHKTQKSNSKNFNLST
jgi:hypothetical protein